MGMEKVQPARGCVGQAASPRAAALTGCLQRPGVRAFRANSRKKGWTRVPAPASHRLSLRLIEHAGEDQVTLSAPRAIDANFLIYRRAQKRTMGCRKVCSTKTAAL
jgi:hypothetical protein